MLHLKFGFHHVQFTDKKAEPERSEVSLLRLTKLVSSRVQI